MKKRLLLIFFILFSFVRIMEAQINVTGSGAFIPESRRPNWMIAGYEGTIPGRDLNDYQNIVNVNFPPPEMGALNIQGTAEKIQIIIDYVSSHYTGLTLLYIPEGYYTLSKTITLKSNMVLKGAGSDKTILKYYPEQFEEPCIKVAGYSQGVSRVASGQEYKSSQIILSQSINGLSTQNLIEITQTMKDKEGKNWEIGTVESISSISPDGKIVYLKDQLRNGLGSDLTVKRIIPITNAGIEDLQIEMMHDERGAPTSINGHLGSKNIQFTMAYNCWVYGVDSYYTGSFHIGIDESSHIMVHGCYFHNANDYGDYGNGYGVCIGANSTSCLVENNIFNTLRHAMVTQLGANKNVFGYNYSTDRRTNLGNIEGVGDIQVHGRWSEGNLFEGNYVEKIKADGFHSANGSYNTFFRNCVYNDGGGAYGSINIGDADYTNVVANQIGKWENLTFDDLSENPLDLYCYVVHVNPNDPYEIKWATHWSAYMNYMNLVNFRCGDISYYHSQETRMLDWFGDFNYYPPIGPLYASNQSTWLEPEVQTIPARRRKLTTNLYTVSYNKISSLTGYKIIITNKYEFDDNDASATYYKYSNGGDPVTIIAETTKTKNGRKYIFGGWSDGIQDNPRIINKDLTVSALYKATHVSDRKENFVYSPQNKIAKTADGVLHLVYESMGKLFYEISADNGASWSLVTAGATGKQPIHGTLGIKPSIASMGNKVAIVTEEYTAGDDYYHLHLYYYTSASGVMTLNRSVNLTGNYIMDSGNPVISIEQDGINFMVVWKQEVTCNYTSGGMGLYYTSDDLAGSGAFDYTPRKVPYTNDLSSSPALVLGMTASTGYDQVYLAYQEENQYDPGNIEKCVIKYLHGNWVNFSTVPVTISSHYGFRGNQEPVVAYLGLDDVMIGWKALIDIADTNNQRISYRLVNYRTNGTYEYKGNDITSYAINGTSARYIRALTFRDPNNHSYYRTYAYETKSGTTTSSSNTPGGDVQLTGTTAPYLMYFNPVTSPYTFYGRMFSAFTKSAEPAELDVESGRIVAGLDSTEIYSELSNVKVNDTYINFIPSKSEAAEDYPYAATEPFIINGSSTLKFSIDYGITLKDKAKKSLAGGKQQFFAIELIDCSNNKTVQTLKEVSFTADNLENGSYNYEVELNGTIQKIYRLKIGYNKLPNTSYTYVHGAYFKEFALKKNNNNVSSITIDDGPVTTYTLFQNYPNPFNPSTIINYDLPQDERVTLKVYNILGQEVATLVDDFKTAGRYNVIFSASHLSTGIYVYELRAGDHISVKKMNFIK